MNSRDSILRDLKNKSRPSTDLPLPRVNAIQYANPEEQFTRSLAGVGGKCLPLSSLKNLSAALQQEEFFPTAQRICSTLPDGVHGNISLESFSDPHDLENIDVGIVAAQFGVAENGAVWLTDAHLKHRAILFIVQHLVILVPRNQIVNTMQDAYERISFEGLGFGVFLSGPSKTADIEQSLVIGAHGPRSMTLYLVDDAQGLA